MRARIRAGALYHLDEQHVARGCLAGLDEDPERVLHCAGALVRCRLRDQRVDGSVEIAPLKVTQHREQVSSRVQDIHQDKLGNTWLHAGVKRLLGSACKTIDSPLQMVWNGSLRRGLPRDRRRVALFLRQYRLNEDDRRQAKEGEQPRGLDCSRGERLREARRPQGTGDCVASARHLAHLIAEPAASRVRSSSRRRSRVRSLQLIPMTSFVVERTRTPNDAAFFPHRSQSLRLTADPPQPLQPIILHSSCEQKTASSGSSIGQT